MTTHRRAITMRAAATCLRRYSTRMTLSQALTAEQAEALSTFFSALGQELDGHGDDSPSDSDDDMDDTAGYEDSDDGTRASLG